MRATALFFVLLTAAAGCRSGAPGASPRRLPHIVLILADDMGYGDPYKYNRSSKCYTPNISRLITVGMRFTDAHAPASVCVPSRYGLLTGRFPMRTSLPWRREACIEEGRLTIASLLQRHGYHTAMVGKWHLGFDGGPDYDYTKPLRGGPLDRGFHSYFGIPHSLDIVPYYYIRDRMAVEAPTERVAANNSEGWSPIQGAFWRAGPIAPGFKHVEVLPRFTEEAVRVIKHRMPDRPLFLYLALPAPHTPWLPTAPFRKMGGAGMYGQFVAQVDATVGRVWEALYQERMLRETLFIFTSDNGPVWYDRDVERFGHDSMGPLRGMKGDAWEAGHRVPFVVQWPRHVAHRSESDEVINFTDLLATLAELVGERLPEGAGEDSVSFLPVLLGRKGIRPPDEGTIMQSSRRFLAIRQGPWKLINQRGSGGFTKPSRVKPKPGEPKGQLYNLADDLGETKNLYAERPEIVARLTALLEKYRSRGRSR